MSSPGGHTAPQTPIPSRQCPSSEPECLSEISCRLDPHIFQTCRLNPAARFHTILLPVKWLWLCKAVVGMQVCFSSSTISNISRGNRCLTNTSQRTPNSRRTSQALRWAWTSLSVSPLRWAWPELAVRPLRYQVSDAWYLSRKSSTLSRFSTCVEYSLL